MTTPETAQTLRLYHAGFETIEKPDIHIGRANADFGQGFYLSADREFAKRWTRSRIGAQPTLNTYALDTAGLLVKRFARDGAWYDYIFGNRAGRPDALAQYDVIIGPIASDTLYDTWGILTSGVLSRELSLELLQLGTCYEQLVIKTERALAQLRFLSSEVLDEGSLAAYRETVRREEEAYQTKIAERLEAEPGFSD